SLILTNHICILAGVILGKIFVTDAGLTGSVGLVWMFLAWAEMTWARPAKQGIPEDYIKMKTFPFSLDGAAKDWLYLRPILFNTWGDMKRMFLEKFFPASRTVTIRKEICGIRQHTGETLHKY
ncbi:hypothetical protein CR513_37157, partial [Mucuna pruriens]